MTRLAGAARPLRMVLDTNVSLDLVVFRDQRWAGLAACLASGACEALMRPDCREEFARVLGYPQFALDMAQRTAALTAFDALHRYPSDGEWRTAPVAHLPQCRDRDDQKFIELAFLSHADVLLSKDKAVLKLARRNRREGLFEILTPAAWLARRAQDAPGT